MGATKFSAYFFQWLQARGFYSRLHESAIDRVEGRGLWYDIGTGPGLIPGLAKSRGFEAWGFDINPASIALARARYPEARFEIESLEQLARMRPGCADVVSLSSLLFVVRDRKHALEQAWTLLRPGGELLIIESTERMAFANTLRYCWRRREFGIGLPLWGLARGGKSVLAGELRAWTSQKDMRQYDELDGLVKIMVIKKQ